VAPESLRLAMDRIRHRWESSLKRRTFLTASLASAALAAARAGEAQPPATSNAREYYLLRRYQLQAGPQTKIVESYIGDALIPALSRMRMGPIGAFKLDYGPETPAFYVLIPGRSVDALATIDLQLGRDANFLKAAEPFWNAPATAPAFLRMESTLLAAFEGWPRLTPPAATATKRERIFQLRTYESPSDAAHVRKVEMFHKGEFEIFQKAGCHPVFFGDALIGSRLPQLTYMLSFAGLAELDKSWDAFRADPDWKKLSSSPRYNYEAIVYNISNLVLSPLAASQI
jgi:NIPSNAP